MDFVSVFLDFLEILILLQIANFHCHSHGLLVLVILRHLC